MGNGKTILIVLAIISVLVAVGFIGHTQGWWLGDENQCDKEVCGDGTCDSKCETVSSCMADCFDYCATDTCGNGVCSAQCGETEAICPQDCNTGQNNPCAAETCGNGVCNPQCETEAACPTDCATQQTAKPIEQLSASCKNKFTQAAVTAGNISFYTPGADVSDPYVNNLDLVNCGSNTQAMILQTLTEYDVYYNGFDATYYDEKIGKWKINYNPATGKGYLLLGGVSYHAVTDVGTFTDLDTLPEVQTGMVDNGTNILNYNETVLGGSGWWKMDIGNNDANSELKEVVMCFRDNDGDMEGTEVTAFTAAFDSGSSAISIPGSLQQYWEDAMGGAGAQCVDIAAVLGSSQKARWVFTTTIDEANFAEDSEEFEMTFDDLGNYLQKQYPSRNAKATAESLTVGTTV